MEHEITNISLRIKNLLVRSLSLSFSLAFSLSSMYYVYCDPLLHVNFLLHKRKFRDVFIFFTI